MYALPLAPAFWPLTGAQRMLLLLRVLRQAPTRQQDRPVRSFPAPLLRTVVQTSSGRLPSCEQSTQRQQQQQKVAAAAARGAVGASTVKQVGDSYVHNAHSYVCIKRGPGVTALVWQVAAAWQGDSRGYEDAVVERVKVAFAVTLYMCSLCGWALCPCTV